MGSIDNTIFIMVSHILRDWYRTWWVSQDEKKSLYTWVPIWVNIILVTRVIYLGLKVCAWYIDPIGIEIRNILKYLDRTDIKNYEIFIIC